MDKRISLPPNNVVPLIEPATVAKPTFDNPVELAPQTFERRGFRFVVEPRRRTDARQFGFFVHLYRDESCFAHIDNADDWHEEPDLAIAQGRVLGEALIDGLGALVDP